MIKKIIFGAGCFWGVEKYFAQIIGIRSAISGYSGGEYPDPTYEKVLQNRENIEFANHNEVVQVTYDSEIISTQRLLQHFWEIHNPTQINRQGSDIGNNYRSSIYWENEEQYLEILKTKVVFQSLLTSANFGKIVTEIKKLDKFYPAEDYHQKYLENNPSGYCPNHHTGVKFVDGEFYQMLGKNILTTEEFSVAFNHGTDPSFCQKYDKFSTTPNGFFVDKLSGEKLFSTNDRFNSGTGWLSFYQAINGSIIENVDNTLGMTRTEVVAKVSGMHLGHVFDEGNTRRFCINASVLDFIEI